MKVHLIKKETIEGFVKSNPGSRTSFQNWLTKLKYAGWDEPNDIRSTFGAADLLGKGPSRVVFNIGGNNYRLIGKYIFGSSQVHLFVCWIDTHRDYDILCRNNKQYFVTDY